MEVYVAEIIGTAILILLGDGVVANVVLRKNKGEGGGWIVITAGWGFAVAMAVYSVGWISGAHINPAVTVGQAVAGVFPWVDVAPYLIAQLIGAMIGALLVWLAYQKHFDATEDPGLKLAVFCTGPEIRNYAWNTVTEVIGTFMLVFGILMIVVSGGEFLTGQAGDQLAQQWTLGTWPLIVGFLVFSIGLSLGGPTGYAINPARDLGPRIMHALLPIPGKGTSDWAYSWVPVVGPLLGAVIAGLAFLAVEPLFI
ncbi:aquaporin family protein [Egibacter rhizosphaerae]|uniref:Aquaporin family protein n=1 Tax=Egibacter rhizosphaerae TaxID=1670831 RepID=A0A411YGT7_9ACTN|nr:MIP/aquaporin family protein [Egibacter rhizosphaerae]QBI20525.1 aquaporin family protein [Egibacter rhizosphaerae]QBI20672.1 aquaporin family protein [Egibacter rhizosphaerae]